MILFFMPILMVLSSFSQSKAKWRGKVEYEDGIKVIKNPAQPLYGEIIFDLELDLGVGSTDDETSTFYNWVRLAVDSKGCILALDSEMCRIQKFNEKGDFLQSIGRKGQGPGEFTRATELILDENDDVYVKESRKLHKFKNSGEYVKTIPLSKFYSSIGFTKDMNFIAFAQTISPTDLSDDVCLVGPDGKTIKTIASFPKPRPDYTARISFSDSTIEPRLNLCSLDTDNTVYSHSARYRLYNVNSTGVVRFIFEKDEPLIPITARDRKQIIDARLKRLKDRGQQISRSDVEKGSYIPKTKPFFYGLLKDDENNIYVRQLEIDRSDPEKIFFVFDLFNKEGYYLYRVKMYPMPLVIKKGHFYSTRRDRDGYLFIERHKIKNWGQIKGIG